MKMKRFLALSVAILLITTLFAGCGKSSMMDVVQNNQAVDMEAAVPEEGLADSVAKSDVDVPENQKLIRTLYVDAETENMDELLTKVDARISELGGYVEAREVTNDSIYAQYSNRYASLTIRIPAEQVDSFVSHVDGISNIVSTNESVEDVTLTYVDTESRMKALETEQTRLLELLEGAETMSDLLEIEGRLTEVRYQLESVASQLRTMDNLVSYATVYLYISEVQEYTPTVEKTPWQRIGEGFVSSLKEIGENFVEFFVWLLSNLPHLIIWGILLTAAVVLLRKFRKKRKIKKAPRQEEQK